MTTKHNILLFLLCLISISARSQESIGLISRPMPDSIMLRWAPASAKVWRLGNQYGYHVKRYTLLRNKKMLKQVEEQVLTAEALKPAPVEQWEPHADNKYVGIAAECIYASVFKDVPTGGNPHIAYKKYQEELQRYSFAVYSADQSLQAAQLSGLYLADKTAKANEKYLYRVFINCPDSLAVDTAFVFTGQSAYQPLPKPIALSGKWDDKKVQLSWDIQTLKHVYNSYVIEKSLDSGHSYALLDSNAVVQLSDEGVDPRFSYRTDTLPDNRTQVYYRIRGINAFGQMGPPSDSIFGTGQLPIKNAPVIVSNEVINNQYVELKWEYPEEMNDYIAGFKIYRAESPKRRHQLILRGEDSAQRSFVDSTADINNYYRIAVYREREEKLSPLITYAARIDSFPPAPPQIASALIDSVGRVTIRWQANTESDMNGYRVYASNHPDFEYLLKTPAVITDTVFKDSINIRTLTRDIYYKVKAEDVRMNQSAFSKEIQLVRPDVIPPVAPLLRAVNDEEGLPQLQWINSSSADVARHHVYRNVQNDTIQQLVISLPVDGQVKATYTDKSVAAGQTYVYRIVAEDESGLLSPPSKTMLFRVPSGIVESIKLKRRLQTDKVKLTWAVESDKSVQKVLVYRSVNNAAMQLYGHTTDEVFYDDRLSPQKVYEYAVKVIYNDGSSSALSKSVQVKM